MGEITRRSIEIVAKTAGNTISPAVSALMTSAAVVTHNPELALVSLPVGAFAGALTEQGVTLVNNTLHDRAERVERFAEAVAAETDLEIEDFVAKHVDSGAKRDLLGHIVAASANARSDWKVKILARAFVRGAKDGDLVDETVMFVRLVADLDPPHARYLGAAFQIVVEVGRERDWDYLEQFTAKWADINKKDPGVTAAAPILRQRLIELHLMTEDVGERSAQLTDLGVACARWLSSIEAETSGRTSDNLASGG